MEAKHAPGAVRPITEPLHEPPERGTPPTLAEAMATVREVIGADWAHTYDRHETPEGVVYVDTETGTVHKAIPNLGTDGRQA